MLEILAKTRKKYDISKKEIKTEFFRCFFKTQNRKELKWQKKGLIGKKFQNGNYC